MERHQGNHPALFTRELKGTFFTAVLSGSIETEGCVVPGFGVTHWQGCQPQLLEIPSSMLGVATGQSSRESLRDALPHY